MSRRVTRINFDKIEQSGDIKFNEIPIEEIMFNKVIEIRKNKLPSNIKIISVYLDRWLVREGQEISYGQALMKYMLKYEEIVGKKLLNRKENIIKLRENTYSFLSENDGVVLKLLVKEGDRIFFDNVISRRLRRRSSTKTPRPSSNILMEYTPLSLSQYKRLK